MKWGLLALWLAITQLANAITLQPHVNPNDKASLQRGAQLFMQYCLGCHSLKYIRYNTIAKDIGITDAKGEVNKAWAKEHLLFTGDNILDTVQTALSNRDAIAWFGIVPPDLSLITRVRGPDWLYAYLQGFYRDPKQQWGANNIVNPNVAMPNVLLNLQGEQYLVYNAQSAAHLTLVQQGIMTSQQYADAVDDIVNFLSYVGEPNKLTRMHIGIGVMIFMGIFAILAFLLKREYWKNIST